MYESLLLPWSPPHLATAREQSYRAASLLRTKGTIFLLPPPAPTLLSTYLSPPRPRSRMCAGAVALCKHFERGGASSEHGRMHPYWEIPKGSNAEKDGIAKRVLERLMGEVLWRNVMLLHRGVAVYEVRNGRGWGMRWTLVVEEDGGGEDEKKGVDGVEDDSGCCDEAEGEEQPGESPFDQDGANKSWKILSTTFRGFVEPIEGMDHELDEI